MEVYLEDTLSGPILKFDDGRHRFSVMRDMGMPKIKFAMNKESFAVAKKYGLVAE